MAEKKRAHNYPILHTIYNLCTERPFQTSSQTTIGNAQYACPSTNFPVQSAIAVPSGRLTPRKIVIAVPLVNAMVLHVLFAAATRHVPQFIVDPPRLSLSPAGP